MKDMHDFEHINKISVDLLAHSFLYLTTIKRFKLIANDYPEVIDSGIV